MDLTMAYRVLLFLLWAAVSSTASTLPLTARYSGVTEFVFENPDLVGEPYIMDIRIDNPRLFRVESTYTQYEVEASANLRLIGLEIDVPETTRMLTINSLGDTTILSFDQDIERYPLFVVFHEIERPSSTDFLDVIDRWGRDFDGPEVPGPSMGLIDVLGFGGQLDSVFTGSILTQEFVPEPQTAQLMLLAVIFLAFRVKRECKRPC